MNDKFSSQQRECFDAIITQQGSDDFLKEDRALSAEFDVIIGLMTDLPSKKILDIGCGNGRHALKLARRASEAVGVDISKKSIEAANQMARERKIENFQGIVSDYSRPVREKYFDYALMVNVLHHIDDLGLVLRNARESLKEDGELIILEFNPLNILFIPFLIRHGQTRVHFNTKYFRSNIYSLKKHLERNGFHILSVRRHAFLPTMLYNYSPWFERINQTLNATPIINRFCAFHVIQCTVAK